MNLSKEFEQRFGLDDISKISEQQLFGYFTDMRNGIIKRKDGKNYRSPKHFVKDYKSFWHWWMKVNRKRGIEIKDITLPDNMQRAMAKEAEAERERRAKIVAAEGEFPAAQKLGEAADLIAAHPVALQLRTLQTMAEISVEKNSTIIFPAQFMTTIREAVSMINADSGK